MNARTVELVQSSFKQVIPIADQVMVIFYDKLFEINPTTSALFPASENAMGQQRNKLKHMLLAAVAGLSNVEKLIPKLQQLGSRHGDYGVQASHYDDVGAALLGTLEIGLGDAFTEEVKAAWVEVYDIIAKTMIEASEAVPQA